MSGHWLGSRPKLGLVALALTLSVLACASLAGNQGGEVDFNKGGQYAGDESVPTFPPAGTLPTAAVGYTDVQSDLLFEDDFSNPESGWDRFSDSEGSTDYFDGVYRIEVATDSQYYWANPDRLFGDVIVEVNAIKVSGGKDDQYGVICRYQDIDNFYALVISTDGFAAVRKRINGGDLAFIAGFVPVEVVHQGYASNQLRAECGGNRLALYVNGILTVEAFDADIPEGDVGLLAGTFNASATKIDFDNFKVSEYRETKFFDNFSNPESGWDRYENEISSADYGEGDYRIILSADKYFAWATPYLDYSDVIVEVDAVKISGADESSIGIICRHKDIDNFYALVMGPDGLAAIHQRYQGGDIELLTDWFEVEAINPGSASNHLRAECIGDRLALYVNGQLAVETFDNRFASGDVGLIAGTNDQPNLEVSFDDFIVR